MIHASTLSDDFLSISNSRMTKRATAIDQEFAKYREQTERSQVDEVSSLTSDFNNREEVLKAENARLTSSLFTANTTLTELKAKLGELRHNLCVCAILSLLST